MPRRPLDVLEASLGDEVSVLLKDDTRYAGRLAGFDQHMNIVLEDARVESDDGEDANGEPGDVGDERSGGDAGGSGKDTIVIRGDNVVSITP